MQCLMTHVGILPWSRGRDSVLDFCCRILRSTAGLGGFPCRPCSDHLSIADGRRFIRCLGFELDCYRTRSLAILQTIPAGLEVGVKVA